MKKWLILALCLLLCGSAQAAVSVRTGAGAAILDRNGSEIVPVGVYDDLVSLGNDLFAGEKDKLYILLGNDGMPLGESVYQDLQLCGDFLMAKQNGLWGMLNPDGTRRSEFAYTLLVPNGDGGCWALKDNCNDNESDRLYLLDANGRETETGIYARELNHEPAEGLLPLMQPDSSLWGYCDSRGSMAIPPSFEYAGNFANDRAVVVAGGKYGCIDRSGNYVLAPEFDFLEVSEAGFIVAARNMQGAFVFDLNGNETANYEGQDVFIALAGSGYTVTDMEKTRVYGSGGELLLEEKPTAVVSEGVGDQLIISDGAWGEECVRLSGSDALYQNLYPLGTAGGKAIYACMTANVGRYMNDLLGEIQYSADMDSVRYGLVDESGKLLLENRYHSLEYLEDDRLLARSDEQWQMISSDGTVLWSLNDPMQIAAPSF